MWPKLQHWSAQLGLVMDLDTWAENNVTLASVVWEVQETEKEINLQHRNTQPQAAGSRGVRQGEGREQQGPSPSGSAAKAW